MAAPAPVVEPVAVVAGARPAVRGALHRPAAGGAPAAGLVLAHGAGSDCHAPLLVDLAAAFAAAGWAVLRCDLPFRQARPHGPPGPADAARDREGLRGAAEVLRGVSAGPVVLGGLSYGGRQASILAAEAPGLAAALLLLAYPLHRPARPTELRADHFPRLTTPTLFVHGTHDPFGAVEELEAARRRIPAPTRVLVVRGSHDLGYACSGGPEPGLAPRVVAALEALLAEAGVRRA